MQNFNDEDGNTWGIEIDRAMLRAVKKDTGVLLSDLFLDDMALLGQLCRDPLLAGDVLWCCCREQADSRKMDAREFERLTDGDSFEAAVRALIEAIIDFFPAARQDQLRKLMDLGEQMTDATIKAQYQTIEEEIQKMLERTTQSDCTTSSKASSASTETEKA